MYNAAQSAHDRRPLSPGFRGTCKQTRDGGGLPEGPGIPPGITHDLVLLIDLPARRLEREERLLAMRDGDLNATLADICREGGGDDARFLLARGGDADHSVADRSPLIWHASHNGHLSVVEALVDAGAGHLGLALVVAAQRGQTAVVALLLDRGADVHFDGDTALWCAVWDGRLQMATLLLDRGANPNARHWSLTVLMGARHRDHHEMVALLLARGAVE
jgi:ankyrin repeat protein